MASWQLPKRRSIVAMTVLLVVASSSVVCPADAKLQPVVNHVLLAGGDPAAVVTLAGRGPHEPDVQVTSRRSLVATVEPSSSSSTTTTATATKTAGPPSLTAPRIYLCLNCARTVYGTLDGAGGIVIHAEDLPSNPAEACAVPAIKSAFAVCAMSGPSASCCQGLDAVFAKSSSPSYGCLCYPQVLYKTAIKASQAGLDVLGLLSKCRVAHKAAFRTPWAAAEPTDCPYIPPTARAADMVTLLGDHIILPTSRARGDWAWGNLLQFGEISEHIQDLHAVFEQLFGLPTLKFLLLIIITTGPLFLFMDAAVLSHSAMYKKLGAAERMIVCQHSVYAVVFSLSFMPQTVMALTAMFKAWTGSYLASPQLAALAGVFIASRAMLYIVEASTRSVIKRSWLLIVHHQLFFLIIVMGIWLQDTAVIGIGIVLDLFACHEAPLYVALVGYRLAWKESITCAILCVACAWYVLTRVFQTVVIAYMIWGFAQLGSVKSMPEFIITALLFGAFTVIQAYTLVIYYAIYRKLCRPAQKADKTAAAESAVPLSATC